MSADKFNEKNLIPVLQAGNFFDIIKTMKLTRRQLLKNATFTAMVIGIAPRVALSAPNTLRSLRTGAQPGGKTRLVIETATRPSYNITYGDKQFTVNLSNTNGSANVSPKLANGTLIKRLTQIQDGTKLQISVALSGLIDAIEKNQIMILEPNGDNDYRLVIDFTSGTGRGITNTSATTTTIAKSATPTTVKSTTTSSSNKQRIIVIDAGHGGKDPGCIGKGGTQEKTVVLSVAKKLKKKLDANGYKTYLTRSTDVYLKLGERAEFAEKKHADLFISLHANANPSRDMKGFSIYTLSEKDEFLILAGTALAVIVTLVGLSQPELLLIVGAVATAYGTYETIKSFVLKKYRAVYIKTKRAYIGGTLYYAAGQQIIWDAFVGDIGATLVQKSINTHRFFNNEQALAEAAYAAYT